MSRKTTEQFIEDAKKIHGDKYDYSETEYVNSTTRVKIFCKKCNNYFWKRPTNFLGGGQGCPTCGKKERDKKHYSNTSDFIEKAKKIHGDKYDYSETNYVSSLTKIKIICKEHGTFFMTPRGHLNGYGCTECGKISRREKCANHPKKKTLKSFIEDAKKVHGDKYDYSETEYVNDKTKVKIKCVKCNEYFWQKPGNHISGRQGCPKCNGGRKKAQNTFVKELKEIYGDELDYSYINYVNDKTHVKLICKKCNNQFFGTPSHLLKNHSCPYCKQSIGEKSIKKFLEKNNMIFERNKTFDDLKDKKLLSYDFYVPKYNLLIEFNGKQHYEQVKIFQPTHHDFHKQLHHDWLKRRYALKNNYRLIILKYNEANITSKLNDYLLTKK